MFLYEKNKSVEENSRIEFSLKLLQGAIKHFFYHSVLGYGEYEGEYFYHLEIKDPVRLKIKDRIIKDFFIQTKDKIDPMNFPRNWDARLVFSRFVDDVAVFQIIDY